MRSLAALALLLVLAPAAAAQGEPLVAFFTVTPTTLDAEGSVRVDARASEGDIAEYAWRWSETEDFTPGNVTDDHAYTEAGVHIITLRVTGEDGEVSFANQTLLVRGIFPTAYVSVRTEETDEGLRVVANASFSTPSEGASRIVKYEWDFGDGFFEGNITETRVLTERGTQPILLRVTDDLGRTAVKRYPVQVESDWTDNFQELWLDRTAFLDAAKTTLGLAIGTTVLGFALAVVIALLRISKFKALRWPALWYIEIIRGTPLLVQILFAWLVLPYFGIRLPALYAGALALVINTAAYQAEAIRAGVQSIPTGQMEAAISLGMSYLQAMRRVIVPQAFRLTLPALGNEFIILLKDTSLVYTIGVIELTFIARAFSNRTFIVIETWLVVAAMYFVMTYTLSLGLRWLEKRLAIPGMGLAGAGH